MDAEQEAGTEESPRQGLQFLSRVQQESKTSLESSLLFTKFSKEKEAGAEESPKARHQASVQQEPKTSLQKSPLLYVRVL